MKIVIAPNAFKGSLSAREAAEAMARGVHRAVETAQVVLMPTADGGDGLLDVLQQTSDARFRPRDARRGPWLRRLRAH